MVEIVAPIYLSIGGSLRTGGSGSHNYYRFGNDIISGLLNGASATTFHCWAKWDSFDSGSYDNRIITWLINGSTAGGAIGIDGTTNPVVIAGGRSVYTDGFQGSTGSTILTAGRWYSIAVIYDWGNDTIEIFIDGISEGSDAVTFANATYTQGGTPANEPDTLGSDQQDPPADTTAVLNGCIAYLTIWNRALEANELLSIAKGVRPIRYSTSIVYSLNTDTSGLRDTIASNVLSVVNDPKWNADAPPANPSLWPMAWASVTRADPVIPIDLGYSGIVKGQTPTISYGHPLGRHIANAVPMIYTSEGNTPTIVGRTSPTVVGTPVSTGQGVIGGGRLAHTGLYFSGTDEYLNYGDDTTWNVGTSDFSFTIMFDYTGSQPETYAGVAGKGFLAGDVSGYGFYLTAANDQLSFQIRHTATSVDVTAAVDVSDDQVHIATGVVDRDNSSGMTIWLDGVLYDTGDPTARSASLDDSNSLFSIASRNKQDQTFLYDYQGSIMLVLLHKTALTPSQIQWLHREPFAWLGSGIPDIFASPGTPGDPVTPILAS